MAYRVNPIPAGAETYTEDRVAKKYKKDLPKILSKKHNVEQCVLCHHLGKKKNQQKKNTYFYLLVST